MDGIATLIFIERLVILVQQCYDSHTTKGVRSKSMNTRISFIGQMSDSILRLILPKNFYDLQHAIPQMTVGITSQIFSRSIPPPPHLQKTFPIHKHQLFRNFLCPVSRSIFYRGRAFVFLYVTFEKSQSLSRDTFRRAGSLKMLHA